jgi:NAD(P)-dependent dehydrogenase (short-subunit alcohol dehydrogenase family)
VGVAVVTGAGSGLGLRLSIRLTSDGGRVVGVSRTPPSDEHLRKQTELGLFAHVQGDVSDPETAEHAFTRASALGVPDLLINCAGAGIYGAVGSYSRRDVDEVLAGNLYGTILFCEAAYRRFSGSGGTIVNVLSTAAQMPKVNEAIYCAAKWGARGYTESLRLEAKGSPVRVVAVYPGGMDTPFWWSARGSRIDPTGFMDADDVAEVIIRTLARPRSGHVSDITINRS